jgi:hypothetical protein
MQSEDKRENEIHLKYPNGLPTDLFECTWLSIWEDIHAAEPLLESELYTKYRDFAACHPAFLLATQQKKISQEQIRAISQLRKETNGQNPRTLPFDIQLKYFKELCKIIPLSSTCTNKNSI